MESTEKTVDTEFQERLDRCIPVAKEVIKMIADSLDTIVFGDGAECSASMNDITGRVLTLFVERNILWADRQFIGSLIIQPFAHLNEKTETALGISWNKAVTKLFGKDALDLTFQDLDATLKS